MQQNSKKKRIWNCRKSALRSSKTHMNAFQNDATSVTNVGCVFTTVISSEFRPRQYRGNNHQQNAPQFRFLKIMTFLTWFFDIRISTSSPSWIFKFPDIVLRVLLCISEVHSLTTAGHGGFKDPGWRGRRPHVLFSSCHHRLHGHRRTKIFD